MFRVLDRSEEKQGEFWLERERLPKARMNAFYAKLEKTLEGMGFTEGVCELCRPAYAEEAKGGRHGIDPQDAAAVKRFERVLKATGELAEVCEDVGQKEVGETLTADKGYFALEGVATLQAERIEPVIGDPHEARRRRDKLCEQSRAVLDEAKQSVESERGKALLKKRSELVLIRWLNSLHGAPNADSRHKGLSKSAFMCLPTVFVESSFAHVLDAGGMRRTTLRGLLNITKRYKAAALTYNLSLLMRQVFGYGTPKQYLAGNKALKALLRVIFALARHIHRPLRLPWYSPILPTPA